MSLTTSPCRVRQILSRAPHVVDVCVASFSARPSACPTHLFSFFLFLSSSMSRTSYRVTRVFFFLFFFRAMFLHAVSAAQRCVEKLQTSSLHCVLCYLFLFIPSSLRGRNLPMHLSACSKRDSVVLVVLLLTSLALYTHSLFLAYPLSYLIPLLILSSSPLSYARSAPRPLMRPAPCMTPLVPSDVTPGAANQRGSLYLGIFL